MSQVKHVQIAITDGETCPRVRAVADSRAHAYARPGFQLYCHRYPECFGVLFFRSDEDLFEALGVVEVELSFSKTGIGKGLTGCVGQITSQEPVRIFWCPL